MTFLFTSALRPLLAALALCSACLAPAAAAPSLAVTGPASVQLGSSFTLSVAVAGITDLYGFQFDLQFDPAAFRLDGVAEGGFLATAGSTLFDGGTIDNAGGSARYTLGTLIGDGPGAAGAGTLAAFSFTSIGTAAGAASFSLSDVTLLDASLRDVAVTATGLSVSAVPEPATWGLLLAGLGSVAWRARRRPAVAAIAR